MTRPTPDGPQHVAVIGAGIVGVATAIRLLQDGRRVTLIDRAGPGEGTSFGNGGVLASASVVPVTVPGLAAKAPRMLFDRDQPLFLRWRYLPRLLPWLRQYLGHCTEEQVRRIAAAMLPLVGDSLADHMALAGGSPAERFIHPCDYAFIYRDRTAFDADRFGWALRREFGFRWSEEERQALQAAEPAFGAEAGFAARLPDHGRISDPGAYVKALAAHAESLGATALRGEVTDFVTENGRLTGLRIRGETLSCDAAVVATGAWSRALVRRLGLDVPLETERGYHVELVDPNMTLSAAYMIAAGKFVITPMEGRIRLAGIVEFGGLDAPPSRAPFDLLRRQIARTMPGLRWSEEREWMGHRPAPTDSIPLIGPVPGAEGVWLGFGHHHVGLTSGPRTGQILAGMIAGRQLNLDVTPYRPLRFAKR